MADWGDGAAAYERGDYETAFVETQLLAEQGDAKAQYALGAMHATGGSVPEDYVQAYACWNLAAAQGDEDAKHNKPKLAKQMTPRQIEKAQQSSKELYVKIPH